MTPVIQVTLQLINDGEVEEHMLGLIDASDDQSADGLTGILLQTLQKYNLAPETSGERLVGQSYDGAATMSGELNGVQQQIQGHYPAAYCNHCVADRMSLCTSRSASKLPQAAKFFGITDKLISFFRSSPKRTRHLGFNLPKPGNTRWLSCDSAISVLDSCYETIGTVLYQISNSKNEKIEAQTSARGLGIQIQQVEFVFLLKLYRKIFENCMPIITMMQKPTLDAIQSSSMLDNVKRFLESFDFAQVWEDTLQADPAFLVIRARDGWRGMEQEKDGSHDSWRESLTNIGRDITANFSEQLSWRFANLSRFEWMNLIHPTKFAERKRASSREQQTLIEAVYRLYPFAVSDITATEYILNVLYKSNEISLLLQKLVRDRDALVARKKEKRRKVHASMIEVEADTEGEGETEAQTNVEDHDEFEVGDEAGVELDTVREGTAPAQDLLSVIKNADLADALPQAMILLELAVSTPLTSVHCERVFSRMKHDDHLPDLECCRCGKRISFCCK